MNLVIDIGNTRAKALVFSENKPIAETTTDHRLTGLAEFSVRHPIQAGIFSITAKYSQTVRRAIDGLPFPVMRFDEKVRLPIQNLYRSPKTLGPDRLAAVIGAQALQPKRDLLVIDCGTCITYDFLDAEGNYRGGNISPGLQMRLTALNRQTARLPLVNRQGQTPEIGYDTETAIRSGVIRGIRHEIEGYIKEFREKYPAVLIFLTGGDAINLDMSKESSIFADEFLVPRGLNQILNYNK